MRERNKIKLKTNTNINLNRRKKMVHWQIQILDSFGIKLKEV
jgi:hypothetical protein